MYFWHTGILTHDIEKTLSFLGSMFGASRDKWTVMDIDFPQDDMLAGDGGKLRAAFGRVGGTVYELLQPMDGTSYHAKQLKLRGPGFHHNAYVCEDKQDEAVAALIASGGRIVWEFRHSDERACYVESEGTVLEIINCCPFMPGE